MNMFFITDRRGGCEGRRSLGKKMREYTYIKSYALWSYKPTRSRGGKEHGFLEEHEVTLGMIWVVPLPRAAMRGSLFQKKNTHYTSVGGCTRRHLEQTGIRYTRE